MSDRNEKGLDSAYNSRLTGSRGLWWREGKTAKPQPNRKLVCISARSLRDTFVLHRLLVNNSLYVHKRV